MRQNVRHLFAEIGDLKAGAEDFHGKHDPKRAGEYVEHLSREYKRLNRLVEFQNQALERLLDDDSTAEVQRILDEPDTRSALLDARRSALQDEAEEGCQIACETCYFDIDGCATACTEEVY